MNLATIIVNSQVKFVKLRYSSIKIFTKTRIFKFHKLVQMHYSVRWKRSYYFTASIFKTICAKFYQHRTSFVDNVRKIFAVFLVSQFQVLFTYKTRTLSFTE